MIEAKNISFRYGSRSALDGVSLKVEDGEFAAILGANGAGKSTLLKVMSGYLKPSPGEILINGCPASKMSPAKLAKERAVLEQESLLSSDYTVLETVLLGRYAFSPFAADDAEGRTIALAAIKSAGLEGFENRLYTQLSGGEKRRVQLARAICQIGKDPRKKILFLDEPSAGLDPAHAHAAMAAAKKLSQNGCSIVAILHDANLAAEYADKIALLKSGEILAFGAPENIITAELMEKTYSARCEIIKNGKNKFVHFPKDVAFKMRGS